MEVAVKLHHNEYSLLDSIHKRKMKILWQSAFPPYNNVNN